MPRKSTSKPTNRPTPTPREPLLTPAVLGRATRALQGMGQVEKLALIDEIHNQQPNLLYSVLVVHHRSAATHEQLEPLIELLIFTWQAMKLSGHQWPLISEQQQEACLHRLASKIQRTQGLPAHLRQQALQEHVNTHPEPYLLAHAYAELITQGWDDVVNNTIKHLALASLNLVECVATVGSGIQSNSVATAR